MSTPKIYISETQRTDEHDKVDSEIQRCLKEGWDPQQFASIQEYSNFLNSEVEYGFLSDRVAQHLKTPTPTEIDYSGEDH